MSTELTAAGAVKGRNPDTVPSPDDPNGPCPRCGRVSNFTVAKGSTVLRQVKLTEHPHAAIGAPGYRTPTTETADVLTCSGCRQGIVVVTEREGSREVRVLHIYPAPGAGQLDEGVNPGLASAFDEGMRCLSVGANRAAVVMFRAALHIFVKDKGNERASGERHLKKALKEMKTSQTLHESLWGWVDHLNQLGNEGAHPEDYDEVTGQEATDLGKFVRNLILVEYELPARLARARG